MSNFIIDCINADAILEQIDDYIENWHDRQLDIPVHEYLGMTEKEYFLWVENDFMLKFILKAHINSKDIDDVLLEEYESGEKMAARAKNPEEAREIYKWLIETGKIKGKHEQ